MAKYRRTQNLVDAVQWTGNNPDEVFNFMDNQPLPVVTKIELRPENDGMSFVPNNGVGVIPKNGWLVVEKTNKIATTVYTDELFQNLFEFVLSDED